MIIQTFRIAAGVVTGFSFILGLYFGPQDSAVLLSYLSLWGIAATFASSLMQFKAANYENLKLKSTSKDDF